MNCFVRAPSVRGLARPCLFSGVKNLSTIPEQQGLGGLLLLTYTTHTKKTKAQRFHRWPPLAFRAVTICLLFLDFDRLSQGLLPTLGAALPLFYMAIEYHYWALSFMSQ